jgi:hypothetical protein
VTEQGARTDGLATPGSAAGVFDDPGVIRRLVKCNGPHRTMASYHPGAASAAGPQPAKASCPISGRPGRQEAVRWQRGPRPSSTTRLLRAASQLTGTNSHNTAICAATAANNTSVKRAPIRRYALEVSDCDLVICQRTTM